jgi:tetraacyldisaccharide 4'-kinase
MRARRWWAWPLVPLYAAGLAVRDGLRLIGLLRTRRLAWPVISVGSLSAGGAGKTPVVIALAELLKGSGWTVDVLSRGYGRTGRSVERVDLDVKSAAARFGDEPVVIAQRTGVRVWVGADRFAAGVAAEAAEGEKEADSSTALQTDKQKRMHLLDDGFQHRGLTRNVDIVLLTKADLDEALMPAGNRREPLAALRRADVVVLREQERARVEPRVRGLMRADTVVWSLHRELRFTDLTGAGSAGDRSMAFCAIARSEEFWEMLEEAGCNLVDRVAFRDHHAYSMDDMVRMVARAKNCRASGFLTTAKDAVKLDGAMLKRLGEVGPVCVVGLEAKFADESGVLRDLEARCR